MNEIRENEDKKEIPYIYIYKFVFHRIDFRSISLRFPKSESFMTLGKYLCRISGQSETGHW